jgi:hypothetical protein
MNTLCKPSLLLLTALAVVVSAARCFGESTERVRAYAEASKAGIEKPEKAVPQASGGTAKRKSVRRDVTFDPTKVRMKKPSPITHRASAEVGLKQATEAVSRTENFGH